MTEETQKPPNSPESLCDEMMAHLADGEARYPGPRDVSVNMTAIRDRMTKLENAYGSTSDQNHQVKMRRRALQMCGLLIRLIQEGDLPTELSTG